MPKCTKCKKKFVSQYLLDKHLNREIPCDQEIKCEKCSRKFEKKRDLERHMNRKTPCYVNIQNVDSNLLEIEKEKTRQEEEKTKRELQKEAAKIKQEEEKTKREIEKLKLKIELNKQESENKQKEIELRRLKNLDIESAKDKRKEKTATIINNNYTQNINIEAANFINNNFDAKIVCDSDGFKNKDVSHLFEHLENTKKLEKICNDNNSLTDLLANIIKIAYNNDNNPEGRYFIYDKNSKSFFIADDKSKEYKMVNYKDIDKYLKHTANKSYSKIEKVISKNILPKDKILEFSLYKNIYMHGNKPLENPAIIGLDPDNRIEKSENGFIRAKKTNKYDGYFSDSSDEDEYD